MSNVTQNALKVYVFLEVKKCFSEKRTKLNYYFFFLQTKQPKQLKQLQHSPKPWTPKTGRGRGGYRDRGRGGRRGRGNFSDRGHHTPTTVLFFWGPLP